MRTIRYPARVVTGQLEPSARGGIALREIRKRFGARHALAPLTADVPAGTTVGVVGPNGAGKSTLLRILTGVLTPDGGSATVAGAAPGAGRCAMVQPAGRGLHPRLTARHNIEFFAQLWASARDDTDAIAAAMDATHLLDRRVATLSAGEARRIAIACGFVTRAPVVCIDEPFEHLDEAGRAALMTVTRAWTDAGGTVAFAFPHPSDGPACDAIVTLVPAGTRA